MEYIKTFYIVPQALLFFIFIQSILLSMRFSRAFTENEKLTASLFELNESLEKKVMERTLEYRLEKEKAEQAGKIKDKFVSIVSHDLRTPMIGVSNLIDILRAKTYVQSEEDKEGLLKMCSDSVQHSLEMIKQLLNFSRVETGTLRLKLQKIDPVDYIESIVNGSNAQAAAKNIQIRTELNSVGFLFIDPEVFSHVLKNLISNSIKYTDPGGVIWIRVVQKQTQTGIEVQDNGIGMSPELLRDLFNPEKARSRLGTKGETGHGMGLFICKYIVEAHKGEIEFQGEPGKGFLSIIKIPIHD
jgi:signal transduction histidine kinase